MTTPATTETAPPPVPAPRGRDRLGVHLAGHSLGGGALAVVSAIAVGVSGGAILAVLALVGAVAGLGAAVARGRRRRANSTAATARRPGAGNRLRSLLGMPAAVKGRGPAAAGRPPLGATTGSRGPGRAPGALSKLRGKLPPALGGTKGQTPGVGRVPGTGANGPRIPGAGNRGSGSPGGKGPGALSKLRGKLPKALGGTKPGRNAGPGGSAGGSGTPGSSGPGKKPGKLARLRGLPSKLRGKSRDGSRTHGEPDGSSGDPKRRWWHKLFADDTTPDSKGATPPDTTSGGSPTVAKILSDGTRIDLGPGTPGTTKRREPAMGIRKASVSSGNGTGSGTGGGPITAAAEQFVASVARSDTSSATSKPRCAADFANALEILVRGFVTAGDKLGTRWGDGGALEACGIAGKQLSSAAESVKQAEQLWARREHPHLEHIANPGAKGEDGKHGFDVSKQG